MFRKAGVLIFLILLGMSSCQRTDIAAEEEAIKTVLKNQTDAFYNKSIEGESDVWAHEPYVFRGFSIDPVIGWESLRKLYEEVFTGASWPPYFAEHSNHFIHIRDDVAWTVYHQELYYENEEGLTETVEGWEHRILEKKDGKWKIVLQMSGPYPSQEDNALIGEPAASRTELE